MVMPVEKVHFKMQKVVIIKENFTKIVCKELECINIQMDHFMKVFMLIC